MAALRALLVEDSALIMFGLEAVLEEQGMEIAGSAATLAQAMHLAKSIDELCGKMGDDVRKAA